MLRENLDLSQTIFAVTTGSLPCAVAIIKVSGTAAVPIFQKIFSPSGESLPTPMSRGMWVGKIQDLSGQKIDQGLGLVFLSPHSHTGEDTAELQCHGSIPVVKKIEETLMACGARPASRGEFSYRALLNKKVQPSELADLGDVYAARETADLEKIFQRKDAALQERIEFFRRQLLRLQAIFDTAVDFSEEYSAAIRESIEPLNVVIHECSAIIQRYSRFRAGSSAPRLVLVGRPNAGKSSVFNAMLGRYRAIVDERAGTTRDVIEEDIELNGRQWKLVDTAGFRSAADQIEKQGIDLGENYLSAATAWLLVVDGTVGWSSEEEQLLERHCSKPHLVLWNKSDLPSLKSPPSSLTGVITLSATKDAGMDELASALKERFASVVPSASGPLPNLVQYQKLQNALIELETLRTEMHADLPPELLAERNRRAMDILVSVVGEISVEEVLGQIFSDFCIGK